MTMQDVVFVVALFSSVSLLIMVFMAAKGVGFKNFITIFKVKLKARKGWGFVEIFHKTGYRELKPYLFKDEEFLQPFGEGKGRYNFKAHCLGGGVFNLPTISYRFGDSDPINPRTGLQTVTSAMVLENIIARAIKAEATANSQLEEWLKKNWKTVGIGFLLFVGGLLFIIMHQMDTITTLTAQAGKTVILNATTLGK